MKTLERVIMNPDSVLVDDLMVAFNVDEEEALAFRNSYLSSDMFTNDLYQVLVTRHPATMPFWPPFAHLVVTRNDQKECESWSDLQEIKNQLIGPENEAVEIYPAESRLVNMGPARHLWVFLYDDFRIPMGWTQRMVRGEI